MHQISGRLLSDELTMKIFNKKYHEHCERTTAIQLMLCCCMKKIFAKHLTMGTD